MISQAQEAPVNEGSDQTEIVVLMSASLYLSAKVNEHEQAKIRDIINVV